eukprot:gene2114-2603_t
MSSQTILFLLKYGRYDLALELYCDRTNKLNINPSAWVTSFFMVYHFHRKEKPLFDFWSELDHPQLKLNVWKETRAQYAAMNPKNTILQIHLLCGRPEFEHEKTEPTIIEPFYQELKSLIRTSQLEVNPSLGPKIYQLLNENYFEKNLYPGHIFIECCVAMKSNSPIFFQNICTNVPSQYFPLFNHSDFSKIITQDINEGVKRIMNGSLLYDTRVNNGIIFSLLHSKNYELAFQVIEKTLDTKTSKFFGIDHISKILYDDYEYFKTNNLFPARLLDKIQEYLNYNNLKSMPFQNIRLKHMIYSSDLNDPKSIMLMDHYKSMATKDRDTIKLGIQLLNSLYPVPPKENLDHWDSIAMDAMKHRIKDNDFNDVVINELIDSKNFQMVQDYIDRDPSSVNTLRQETLIKYFREILLQQNPSEIVQIFKHVKYDIYTENLLRMVWDINRTYTDDRVTKKIHTIQVQKKYITNEKIEENQKQIQPLPETVQFIQDKILNNPNFDPNKNNKDF